MLSINVCLKRRISLNCKGIAFKDRRDEVHCLYCNMDLFETLIVKNKKLVLVSQLVSLLKCSIG